MIEQARSNWDLPNTRYISAASVGVRICVYVFACFYVSVFLSRFLHKERIH